MRNFLEFEYSAWFILVCILIGTGYSLIQYSKNVPWSERINYLLALTRTILVAVIAILILGPLVRAIKNYNERPIMVMAIDNSESLSYNTDSLALIEVKSALKSMSASLVEKGWDVKVRNLSTNEVNIDSLEFNETRTDLTKLVKSVQNEFDGANLAALLLLSDGIFNTGFSPDNITAYSPIYTVGVGDTIPRIDLSIIDLKYSKIVYKDNRFPVVLTIRNEGIGPVTTNLNLYRAGSLVASKMLTINPETRIINHEFILDATDAGKQRYTVLLEPVTNESTVVNNRMNFYVDVIDGQQKILIVADAPHPDIKAIRMAIESNDQFQVDLAIADRVTERDYDLIIIAHSPSRLGVSKFVELLEDGSIPKLYLVGSQTNYKELEKLGLFTLGGNVNQYDQVVGAMNSDFNSFNIINDNTEWLGKVPPVSVPFVNIDLPISAEILLSQKVGSVKTSKPLVYVIEDEVKLAVMLGEGFWKWRLDEYRRYGSTERYDEIVSKLVKYLAAKPDNRQFKLYPEKDGYEAGEEIVFIAETYNEIFEPLFGEPINLTVNNGNENWRYNFTPLSGSRQFSIDDLPEGLYNYTATTILNNRKLLVNGQFSVEKPDIEAADLTADHGILRKLANESGGEFYKLDQLIQLQEKLESQVPPTIIHPQEKEVLLFNLPWILVLILVLATTEWLTRKMMGGY